MKRLKKIRVVLSLIFFLSISFLFIDFNGLIPAEYFDYFLYLQFIPSIINSLNGLTIATAGFIFIIILTFFFGRIYCSTICPLGTLQDIFSNLYRRYRKKKYYRQNKYYHRLKSYNWIKYSLLASVILIFFSGGLIGIYLLDPFSNFGRIISAFARPIIITLNNAADHSFKNLGIYFLYPFEMKGISLVKIIFPLTFLLLVFIMSVKSGRLFCNTVCPVGTILALISKISFFKIRIIEDKCRSCSLCTKVCKSGCIDRKNKSIDFSRCVSCYNCLTVCPSEGIEFKNHFKGKKGTIETDESKREFIQKVSLYFLGLTGISLSQIKIKPEKENTVPVVKKYLGSKSIKHLKASTVPVFKKYPVTPPGSKSIKHFTDNCLACHLCVSACPTQVLQPSFLEYGFLGMLQPIMEYKKDYCNFECTICSEVCPTGAIEKILVDEKKLTQLGKVKFIKENCIVYTESTACGACSEHCPTKAVNMVPYTSEKTGKLLNIPEIKEEYCIGCGACEHACPTKPYKSIYVEGNPVHLLAKKPEEKKLIEELPQEDFPF